MEEKIQNAIEEVEDKLKVRRMEILEHIWNKNNSWSQDSMEVLFVDSNGDIVSNNHFILDYNLVDLLWSQLNNDGEKEKCDEGIRDNLIALVFKLT